MNGDVAEFIEYRIGELLKLIPDIKVEYHYDIQTDFYVIEVSPERIRRGSIEYIGLEADLWGSFYAKFPNEDLLICEPDTVLMKNKRERIENNLNNRE